MQSFLLNVLATYHLSSIHTMSITSKMSSIQLKNHSNFSPNLQSSLPKDSQYQYNQQHVIQVVVRDNKSHIDGYGAESWPNGPDRLQEDLVRKLHYLERHAHCLFVFQH